MALGAAIPIDDTPIPETTSTSLAPNSLPSAVGYLEARQNDDASRLEIRGKNKPKKAPTGKIESDLSIADAVLSASTTALDAATALKAKATTKADSLSKHRSSNHPVNKPKQHQGKVKYRPIAPKPSPGGPVYVPSERRQRVPTYKDYVQHQHTDDCWVVAPLRVVAYRNPAFIMNLISLPAGQTVEHADNLVVTFPGCDPIPVTYAQAGPNSPELDIFATGAWYVKLQTCAHRKVARSNSPCNSSRGMPGRRQGSNGRCCSSECCLLNVLTNHLQVMKLLTGDHYILETATIDPDTHEDSVLEAVKIAHTVPTVAVRGVLNKELVPPHARPKPGEVVFEHAVAVLDCRRPLDPSVR